MAERILSPGVFSRENDLSFITPAAAEISTALVGPTTRGPVSIPTVVRSYGEYVNVFGSTFKSGSDYYSHFTTLAAEKYFEQGGSSLLVTRVSDQSFTSATSTVASASTTLFTLATIGQGEIMNNSGSGMAGANNALTSGSTDNVRWEITSANPSLGTFSLVVRRGDDNERNKIILESYSNLSLDPKSPNYIAKQIGDMYRTVGVDGAVSVNGEYPNASKYVYVSNVAVKTPDYFDNNGAAKTAYTVYFNANLAGTSGSEYGSFKSATGTLFNAAAAAFGSTAPSATESQGIDPSDSSAYARAKLTLGNRDEYRFNVLLTPGIYASVHASQVSAFVDLAEERGDLIYVLDTVPYGSSITIAAGEAAGLNSSFAATYWPWVKARSQELGRDIWSPASTVMGGVLAFNDRVGAEWFAPAGLLRGGIPGVTMAERKLSQADRDSLYLSKVNPLATFPGAGVVAYGQKTLQTKASALDRVNVRRLLINLKNFIGEQANTLVFEQNTITTRNRFLANVNPYLETVVQRQGLYAYRVVMDDTNNTADVIDRNQLIGQIFIQPTKTAEFIVLDFVVQPTGATFNV
jgi:phage tail sheath protein FI